MKLITTIFLSLIILSCSDTTEQTFNNTQDIIILEKLPKIGDLLNDSIIHRKQEGQILINSAQFSPISIIKIKGHIFRITWDKNKTVNYIETLDTNFVTNDNIKVNMTLKEIQKVSELEIITENGWGYYIQFNSGWYAGFCVDESCTKKKLTQNDKVKWLFKR